MNPLDLLTVEAMREAAHASHDAHSVQIVAGKVLRCTYEPRHGEFAPIGQQYRFTYNGFAVTHEEAAELLAELSA